jgi:hypothetical protein
MGRKAIGLAEYASAIPSCGLHPLPRDRVADRVREAWFYIAIKCTFSTKNEFRFLKLNLVVRADYGPTLSKDRHAGTAAPNALSRPCGANTR